MKLLQILKSPFKLGVNYRMNGEPVANQTRKLKDLKVIFQDQESFDQMDQEQMS